MVLINPVLALDPAAAARARIRHRNGDLFIDMIGNRPVPVTTVLLAAAPTTPTRRLQLRPALTQYILKNHLETCFADAVTSGKAQPAIAELLDAVKFNPVLTGAEASIGGTAAGEPQSGKLPERETAG